MARVISRQPVERDSRTSPHEAALMFARTQSSKKMILARLAHASVSQSVRRGPLRPSFAHPIAIPGADPHLRISDKKKVVNSLLGLYGPATSERRYKTNLVKASGPL